ncbi:hypothetical protein HELRODRAFT_111776 [Helobdella robusta]|uniref:Transient receptor ion channel domain-containing protein n=1 Tax=Helobdella robusta TaxID=6412 RepID=T1EFE4_HELRO|nr:hypothetical protein HELRODRAFT_111776 [Helobdella robusta]ESO04785.1 hypothetical protein HELRODRAFT_111776 [Helobdella robusta]
MMVRSILAGNDWFPADFNYNCVDYMGRSALHLAVDLENVEVIEMLLDKMRWSCKQEALLHAVNKGYTKTVRTFIEHPSFVAGGAAVGGGVGGSGGGVGGSEGNMGDRGGSFVGGSAKKRRNEAVNITINNINNNDDDVKESSQFSSDLTPLMLAAQTNNHEIIQMFLSKDFIIEKPHWVSCMCVECMNNRETDSLKRSKSRLNTYKALVSPAYMALSSPDPIMTTFQLRQEMKKLAQVEKEFKNEYLSLVEQCMDFACELMDLCRGTQEVEAVLSDHEPGSNPDPLSRLKMALKYDEKKVSLCACVCLCVRVCVYVRVFVDVCVML